MSDRTLLSDIEYGSRMNSAAFTLEEHCSRQGDSPIDLWDFEKGIPLAGWKYVGWVPSSSTCIPESNWGKDCPLAVMLENKKGERVWLHVTETEDIRIAVSRILNRRR